MHPALHSWRDDVPGALVRVSAYLGAAAVLSMAAAQLFQSKAALDALTPAREPWVTLRKPFPAFALSIPEAAGAPARYTIRYNVEGGRQDILSLGDPTGTDPYLEVQIYRAGGEITHFPAADQQIIDSAAALGPVAVHSEAPLMTKFGPIAVMAFDSSHGRLRHCLGFVRSYDEPRLQISGRFCRGGSLIERSTLACALDRLTLLSAGSAPKVGALFAKAELKRQFCGQRDPILAPTPKYRTLWKAVAHGVTQRRIGR
ncbi:MAG TPA: hypothetical protein VE224_17665 [Pseudolabrys sp.]|jgi:hypothetical protein|nr:hypothetical protein [Pseudolabrys sp.]